MRHRKSNRPLFKWMLGFGPILLATIGSLIYLAGFTQWSLAEDPATQEKTAVQAATARMTAEDRMEHLEKTLQSMKVTAEKSESRSYENKMMARELIRYIKAITVILAVAALGFPLAIWLLSRKRLLGLSELSGEVAATLLVVEERQAKLSTILKEIQGEIDYLHTMSVPDLKNLIQQAEKYLKQNEQDLEKAGLTKERN